METERSLFLSHVYVFMLCYAYVTMLLSLKSNISVVVRTWRIDIRLLRKLESDGRSLLQLHHSFNHRLRGFCPRIRSRGFWGESYLLSYYDFSVSMNPFRLNFCIIITNLLSWYCSIKFQVFSRVYFKLTRWEIGWSGIWSNFIYWYTWALCTNIQ